LNLDRKFDKSFNPDIGKPLTNISNTFFHVSANAVTGKAGGRDWYSFTTSQANVQNYLDIDHTKNGLDSWIKLYNSAGKQLSSNNDGNFKDPGSTSKQDSFISILLKTPGLYFVSVGSYLNPKNDQGLNLGQDYTLNISLSAHTAPIATPIPEAVWLFGSGIVGLLGTRRNKSQTASLAA
jgi:hypothetical protein